MEALQSLGLSFPKAEENPPRKTPRSQSARTHKEDRIERRRPTSSRHRSARTPRSGRSESDDDASSESSSSVSEDLIDWDDVNQAPSVPAAMELIWKADPETFYLYGDRILKNLEYKHKYFTSR